MISLTSHPELLTNDEMATADRLTIAAGTPGIVLMERAGGAVAREALRLLAQLTPARARVLVACGPGNNGGDGFIAARVLAEQGIDVSLGLLGPREALKGDAAQAAAVWHGDVRPLIPALSSHTLADADLVIDALFGAGLARDLDGDARTAVLLLNEWTRRLGRPILAVDVPSGLDGSTGAIRGVAIEARRTVTNFRMKPGHLLLPGRLLCGETSIADIGTDPDVLATIQPKCFANSPSVWGHDFPIPRIGGHKYSRGHALVMSGSLGHTGAARLAARGALRAGAGLVSIVTPSDALAAHAAALTAIMTRVCDSAEDLKALLQDQRLNVLVMGPALGVGERTRQLVLTALARPKPVAEAGRSPPAFVLDADALTSFADSFTALAEAIRASGAPVVLTPHDGEFQKLFGGHVRDGSKLERVRAAAALSGAIVLLKGPDSTVAEPGGRATIGYDLPPWLATAGSGDVLAGIIGGLLAQDMPSFEAVSAAVWLHGAAAGHFGPGLISEDIPEHLPPVFRRLIENGIG
jgi:ADP-dependent NAD(P)H-hydrate dehydratase / NAD(P)H-hydrate epimerase